MNLSSQSIPQEGWAMVNGETLRARPTFDQVKISVPADGTSVRAQVIYFDGKPPAN